MRPASMWSYAVSAVSIVAAVVLWQLVSMVWGRPQLLPPPTDVAVEFVEVVRSGELWIAVRDSLTRVVVGYVVGTCLGIATGLAIGRIAFLNATLGLVFDFLKGVPPIALVPLVIIWFGIGEISKYIVIAYIVWIVVTISTTVGVREVPTVRLRTAAMFGLSRLQTFLRIVLPSCLVYIAIGMRSAIGFAFVALVSAELIGANTGIGHLVMDARFSLQTAKMIVALLALGTLGALIQVAFDAAMSRLRLGDRYR